MAKKKGGRPARTGARPTSPLPEGTSANWKSYEKAFQALSVIEHKLGDPGVTVQAFDICGLCRQYRDIAGYIETAEDFLDWLPHGATIRKVIDILRKLADKYCKDNCDAQGKSLAIAESVPGADGARALATIGTIIAGAREPEGARAMDFRSDACDEYRRIKPYIEPSLEVIEWLPYGSTIVKVVRLLMRLADAVC
jgi:hypothetical protein